MSATSLVAKSSALAALTLAVVAGGGLASSQAEAGYKKHHHHGFRIVVGAPLVYSGYSHGYHAHRPCYWLYRNAVNTGSHYWWKRFHQCRYGW
jgi:hypothetical protein